MNVDLEDIRTIVNRHPNIRGKNLLHQLEKRRKVEELRAEMAKRAAERDQRATSSETEAFDRLIRNLLFWKRVQ